jgi:predicted dehydrogenase
MSQAASAQLRAGVIGLGILGAQHVRFLVDQPEVQVAAVADILGERAQEVGGPVGAEVYSDYTRMLAEQRLDLVVVATPDPLHKEPVLAAIRAGAPVVIQEKPMATSLSEAEEMLEAAEQVGAQILIHFSNRGSPMDRATYYVIQQGLLGDVVYGQVHLDDNITVPTAMWGGRTQEWVAGSSTAHFLLSHVVDFLHWVLAPARVTEVYAISQRRVLGYTPDLYDAFLTFDNGCKFRAKAEWIKHIDGLVEFAWSFSGAEGSLFYVKRPSFGGREGWRANLSAGVTPEALQAHQAALLEQGINARALLHRPNPSTESLQAGGGVLKTGLEAFSPPTDWWRVARGFVDAVLEDTLTPSSWTGYGPLPSGMDGLRQTRVVCAIVESAETGKVVRL